MCYVEDSIPTDLGMRELMIIEDDKHIVELISIHLRDLGCQLFATSQGREGVAAAIQQSYDLIILDLMLPDLNGLEVCRQIRANQVFTPILMLTAKSEEIDKVLGLEMGADDYLTKPFSIRELIARIKAIMRRSELLKNEQAGKFGKLLHYKDLTIHPEKRRVTLGEEKITLTLKEFDLLLLLASNPGRNYSRKELLRLVWGYEFEGYEHTVTAHINRLRSKIEPDLSNLQYILTSWGIGYRFTDPEG